MNLKQIINIIEGDLLKKGKVKNFNKIRIDTKKVKENDVFIAIEGKTKNGHDFIEEAIKNKAALIIIDKDIKIKSNVSVIKVKNTLEALYSLARYKRSLFNIPLIAITGSVGKTSTKEIISKILKTKYKVLKSKGNYNNHIGLSMTLLDLDESYDVIVVELGMNHLKEISHLSNICKPDIALITNIGTSHIGNLKSQKNILKAKLEIIDGMSEGFLFVNGDDKFLKEIDISNNVRLIKIKNRYKYKNGVLKYILNKKDYEIKISNKYLINNNLLAIEIGLMFDIDVEEIIKAINNYKYPKQRLEEIKLVNDITLIDDAYNSSYESLLTSLENLKNIKKKKIIILGDILELGDYSVNIHKKIGKKIKKYKFEKLLLVGNDVYQVYLKNKKRSIYFKDNDELICYLKKFKYQDKTILLKASRGMHLEKVRDFLEEQYS